MKENDLQKYVNELIKHTDIHSILIINKDGHLERICCVFFVQARVDVGQITKGLKCAVKAVKLDSTLNHVYIIDSMGYYHYNFIILGRSP